MTLAPHSSVSTCWVSTGVVASDGAYKSRVDRYPYESNCRHSGGPTYGGKTALVALSQLLLLPALRSSSRTALSSISVHLSLLWKATVMCAAAMMSRVSSHGQASCSSSQSARPLPTAAQGNWIFSNWRSRSQTAKYHHITSSRDVITLEQCNVNAGFRRHTCCSTSTEAYATVSGLKADLAAAVSAEDYQRAASLRDQLK